MRVHRSIVNTAGVFGAACLALSVAAGPASAADFPSGNLRIIVPSGPGGGMDRLVRQIQPYVEKQLGVSLQVLNMAGGAFAVGTASAYEAPGDCKTLLVTFEPQHLLTYLTQKVPYGANSFMPLLSMVQSSEILYVQKNSKWKSLQDLIDDAKKHPGDIRLGAATATDPGYYAAKALEDAAGVQFNIITYNGGSSFRNAFRGGEVKVGSGDIFAAIGLNDMARPIGAFTGSDKPLPGSRNPWTGDSVSSVNKELGTDIKATFATTGSVYVKRECYEKHPKRYKILEDAFITATKAPGYHKALQKVGEEKKLVVTPGPEYAKQEKTDNAALMSILKKLNGSISSK